MLDPVVLAGVNFGESYVVDYILHIANLSQWKFRGPIGNHETFPVK